MQIGTIIRDKKYSARFLIGFSIIIFYIGVSISNQIKYIFTPFSKSYQNIPHMLSKERKIQRRKIRLLFFLRAWSLIFFQRGITRFTIIYIYP